MNPTAVKYGAPPLASVNLVPKDIQERRKMRAVQLTAVVAVLIAIGAVLLAFLTAIGTQAAAKSGLDNALARQNEAIGQRDGKVNVYTAYATREAQEFALAQAGFGEIDYSQFATAFANAASDGKTSFETIAYFGPSALGFGGSDQDPLFGTGVGSIQFTARAVSTVEATRLIKRLEALPGVASVRATTESFQSNSGETFWMVDGVAIITPSVLTMRIVPEETVTGVDAMVMVATQGSDAPGVAPTPAPSAAPSVAPSPGTESEN